MYPKSYFISWNSGRG